MLLDTKKLIRYLCNKYDCDNCPLYDWMRDDCMCDMCESVYIKMEREEQRAKSS